MLVYQKKLAAVRNKSGELNSLLVEDIQGNRLIQSFSLMSRERMRFSRIAKELEIVSLQAMPVVHSRPWSKLYFFIRHSGRKWNGCIFTRNRSIFFHRTVFRFLLYANMFYEPIRQLVSINNLIAAGKASGERVFEILDAQIEVENPRQPIPIPRNNHEVQFSNVSFSYAERCPVVKKLSFTLRHGKTTALVGPTGAGKATIANLLLRYYDVEKGSISIGSKNINRFSLEDLGAHWVGFPRSISFDASVKENLLLANPQASDKDMQEALHTAYAWDFVKCLPEGINTLIGERGVRLSMGEKQRLTIARAMLKSSPILILDEATSSVDVETERKIQKALDAPDYKIRTTLIIAHRLSTIREADTIIFLEKGKIIEQGSPKVDWAKRCLRQILSPAGKYN